MKTKILKLISLAMTLALFSSAFVISISATVSGNWSDYATANFDKTNDEWIVDSAEDLAAVAKMCDAGTRTFSGETIYITADIDLGAHYWNSIGNSANGQIFLGTIEGKLGDVEGASVTISNMYSPTDTDQNYGFLARQDAGGLKNLKFENCVVTGTSNNVAVVCGSVRSGTVNYNNITVASCELTHNGTTAGNSGLIVGQVTLGNANLNAENISIVGGKISAKFAGFGAIIGKTTHSTTLRNVNVSGTKITNAVTGSNNGRQMGGLIGIAEGSGTVTLVGCSANITMSGYNAVGGLVGRLASMSLVLANCHTTGTIVAEQSGKVAGAFVGDNPSGTTRIFASSTDTELSMEVGTTHVFTAPTMLDGASIRTTEGSNGLRFTSNVTSEQITAYNGIPATVVAGYTFGTVIALNSKIDANNFTKAALDAAGVSAYADIAADEGITDNEDGSKTFRAALTGMTTDNKTVEFAARSYVEFTLATGDTVRVYSDFTDENVRSMQEVAVAALGDTSTDKNATMNGFTYQFEVAEGKYSLYNKKEREVLAIWAA